MKTPGARLLTVNPRIERVIRFDTIESTNSYAKTVEDLPVSSLMVITADRQTAGRGQRGNSFFSNSSGGLWCTIIQPVADLGDHFRYNRALSLALAQVVEACGAPHTAIKWPNDIYCGYKKICGILLESHPSSSHHIIIGFGLNVNIATNDFPEELRQSATSLAIETGRVFTVSEICDSIIDRYTETVALEGADAHGRYCKRLYGIGRRVSAGGVDGVFTGVADDGRAIIKTDLADVAVFSGPLTFISLFQ